MYLTESLTLLGVANMYSNNNKRRSKNIENIELFINTPTSRREMSSSSNLGCPKISAHFSSNVHVEESIT
jgi:hypothetical protein